MGRPAKGAVRWNAQAGYWVVRVSLASGARSKPVPLVDFNLKPCVAEPAFTRGCACGSCVEARGVAERYSARMRKNGAVLVGTGETVNDWFDRWVAARIAKGLTSTSNDRGRYNKWISPVIGTKPIAEVTRADLEAVVQKLDAAVADSTRSERFDFRWKTATNVWGCCTKMFADACKSKVLGLRVRSDNPARDVEGPDHGVDRVGPYLFPAEFLAVMRCRRVPTRWKRLIAIAVYTYTRRGELAALDCAAVNADRGYVHVHCAADRKGEIKPTKTKDTRKVPIEPSLAPLLERMREDANAEGRLVAAMPPMEIMASRLRQYVGWGLRDAGLPLREDLFADDETRRPLSWHDLRHTGLTWRAVRGDDPMKIMRAAGHSDMATTQLYINEAQTFEDVGTFGVPFPPIPLGEFLPFGGPLSVARPYWSDSGSATNTAGGLPRETASAERPRRDSKVVTESPASSTADARKAEKEGSSAVAKSPPESPVVGADSTKEPVLVNADDALRAAIKAAVDAGDLARATALLDVLKATPTVAPVLARARPGKRWAPS